MGVTGRMCSDKFKNLKTRYKTIQARSHQTGSGGECRQSNWPYFAKMHDLLRNGVAVNPDNVYEIGAARFNWIRRRQVRFLHYFVSNAIRLNNDLFLIFIQMFADEEDEEDKPPVNKRKRISNGEKIELMKSEAEGGRTKVAFLEILAGLREQGAARNKPIEKLVEEKVS